jgi:hypothetical protein
MPAALAEAATVSFSAGNVRVQPCTSATKAIAAKKTFTATWLAFSLVRQKEAVPVTRARSSGLGTAFLFEEKILSESECS